jgi:hypothetical protein
MTLTQNKLAFDQALHDGDMLLLLVTFLRLIAAVQTTIQTSAQHIQALASPLNPDFYVELTQQFLQRDMLAYASVASPHQAAKLRSLLDAAAPDPILDWYRAHWSQPEMSPEEVLISIANALRSVMTVTYGSIQLLRQYTSEHPKKETAYQVITEAVDSLRNARSQLSRPLAAHGLELQAF